MTGVAAAALIAVGAVVVAASDTALSEALGFVALAVGGAGLGAVVGLNRAVSYRERELLTVGRKRAWFVASVSVFGAGTCCLLGLVVGFFAGLGPS